MCPLGGECLFPTPVSPESKPHWSSKPNTGACLASTRLPRPGSPMWGLDPLLRQPVCNCNYPPICGFLSGAMGLDNTAPMFLLQLAMVPFLYP